jgi:hypothetical protein
MAPSDFGFAVAVHPNDPDTAWLVPAKKDEHRYLVNEEFVVSRMQDGGKTFETLRKGLPKKTGLRPGISTHSRHGYGR